MRLLLAARLSRVADGQTGIETQDELTREWAQRNGHTIVHVAADKRSGTSQPWDRPNLKPWVTDPAKLALYDGVVAYRFDRLSRGDDASTWAIEEWARKHGKLLLTEDGLVYPCEGADGIRWDVVKRISHEEWLKTSERYRRMQSHLRANWFLVGDAPFGYMIVPKDGHKVLEINPETAPVVRGMVERYLDGDSLASICRWLDSTGVKPRQGGKWWPTAVRHILGNPALIGRRKDKDKRTILKFEPILDQATWARLQARLAGNPAHRAIADEPSLLSGIIFCGLCGRVMHRKMVYTRRKDGSRKYHSYYRCDGTPRDESTCKNMIRMDFADEAAGAWVTDVIGRAELIERTVIPGSGHEEDIQDVKAAIRDLDPEDDAYDSKLAKLRAELSRLKALPAEPPQAAERELGITVGQYWETADTAARRRFLTAGKVRVLAVSELKARKGTEPRELQFSVVALIGGDWTWR